MKTWGIVYNDNKITIEDRSNIVKLMVNGEVVDTSKGLFTLAILNCHLQSGEIITAVVGVGSWKTKCVIIINGKKVYEN